jgi:hypothetical protein
VHIGMHFFVGTMSTYIQKGRKFELDHSNWTKYRNFLSMYEDIEEGDWLKLE